MLQDMGTRFLASRLEQDEHRMKIGFYVSVIILLFVLSDLIYLHILSASHKSVAESSIQQPQNSFLATLPVSPTICLGCLTLTPTPTTGVKSTPTPSVIISSVPQIVVTQVQQPGVKDYFIPLGTGSSQAADWTDVVGVVATVDFGNYQTIKQITFEASVTIPASSETVSVRLYNVTDKHPVWYSDVTTTGASSVYLTSSPMSYDMGLKTYQVQMKTQLQAPANLTQSRIHITLQ